MKRTFLLSLGVLLYLVVASRFHAAVTDEFGTIWLASRDSAHAIISRVHSSDVHPPTTYLFLHVWGRLFGYGDFAMRLPSTVFVLLSMAVLWKLLFRLRPSLSIPEACAVFVLCASSPVVLIQAATARYYALATLLGLLAILSYLDWFRGGRRGQMVAYIVAAAAAFYLNYIVAALVFLGPFFHYLATWRREGRPPFRTWFIAQALVAACALPIVVLTVVPLLTGANPALVTNRSLEGLSGLSAWPAVVAGHLFTTLTGGVPFPWDCVVVLPVVSAAGLLIVRDLAKDRVLFSPEILWLCIVPFLLVALAVAALLPVAGIFYGAFRVPHIAVLCWVALGFMAINVQGERARHLAIACLVVGNLYSDALYAFNLPSMAQVIPLKQMVLEMRVNAAGNRPLVVHPMTHGWGDAVQRYMPEAQTVMMESGPGIDEPAELQKSIKAVLSNSPSQVLIIQRNRFPAVPDQLSAWLVQNGFTLKGTADFQKQSAADLRFKELLKQIPGLKFNPAPSRDYIWTVKQFDRRT